MSTVLDLISRRVVGWSMKAEHDAQLAMDALMMVVWRRDKVGALLPPDVELQHQLLHEPVRERLVQLGDGELLLVARDQADRTQGPPHSGRRLNRRP